MSKGKVLLANRIIVRSNKVKGWFKESYFFKFNLSNTYKPQQANLINLMASGLYLYDNKIYKIRILGDFSY